MSDEIIKVFEFVFRDFPTWLGIAVLIRMFRPFAASREYKIKLSKDEK